MARFEITGGKPLKGDVRVSGAKNEALKLIPFSILLNGSLVVENVPNISDVKKQLEIFEYVGGKYTFNENSLELNASDIKSSSIVCDAACKLRASIVFMGPMLAKFGKIEIPYPGGCSIGNRPIDTHTDAFKQLGAEVIEKDGRVSLSLNVRKSNKIILKEQSVSATENVLMYCAGVADEITVENCAIEPEIIQLIEKIKDSGVEIERLEERTFKIKSDGFPQMEKITVIPDRIEAGSYLIGMIATGGSGKVFGASKENLGSFVDVLEEAGVELKFDEEYIEVVDTPKDLKPINITTAPFPGFPTDLQSPIALIAAIANGKSEIHEEMFENRLGYLDELKKMGLNAEIADKHFAIINGPTSFRGAEIMAQDLRSGITLLLAALMAEGKTTINNAENIDRGYENIEAKIKGLGGEIKRLDD